MARPRILIVGAGFAGYQTARTLSRLMRHRAEVTLLNPTDYFLYLPLLPEVAAGVLEPRRIAVPLAASLPGVRVVLGEVDMSTWQISGSAGRTPRASGTAAPTTACCWRSAA